MCSQTHLTVLKDEFTCVTAPHAQLVKLLCCSEPLHALLHYECCDAMRTLVGGSLGIHYDCAGLQTKAGSRTRAVAVWVLAAQVGGLVTLCCPQ